MKDEKEQVKLELRKLCAEMYLRNQISRFRDINLTARGEAVTPYVGIFWMDLEQTKVYSDKTPLDEAEDYGKCRIHRQCHYDTWKNIVLLNPKWKGMEYEDIPRGRVVFERNVRKSRFWIYLCPACSRRSRIKKEIINEFKLPEGFYEFRYDDEHYVLWSKGLANI
jgi:hypothetical protein